MKTPRIPERKVAADSSGPDEDRLARLERAGIVRRARKGWLDEIARVPPPAPTGGGDIIAAILDEGRAGR